MPDRLRLVTIDDSFCPVLLTDLESYGAGLGMYKVRGSFKIGNVSRNVNQLPKIGRFNGSFPTSDRLENGIVGATWVVSGSSADDCLRRLESFLSVADTVTTDLYLQWRPQGATRTTYYQLRGTPTYTPSYAWEQFAAYKLQVEVTWPAAPLAQELRMTWYDDFRDRGYGLTDLGLAELGYRHNGGWVYSNIANTDLRPALNLTGQDALIWNESRRPAPDMEVTVYGTQLTGTAAAVSLEAGLDYDPADGAYVYATLNSSGNLLINHYSAGTTTTRATSATTTAVPANNVFFWVRCRAEGNYIYGEMFTSEPSETSTPNVSVTWKGADAFGMGAARTGYPVFNVTPPVTAATKRIARVDQKSYQYRLVGWPIELQLPAIPGNAPAAVDLEVNSSTTENSPPRFVVVGWRPYRTGTPPLGTNEIQRVSITGTPTGGTFTLTFEGFTTAAIARTATAAQVRDALELLSNIRPGDITTTGGPLPTAVDITFGGYTGRRDITQMTFTNSLTGGSSPTPVISTPTAGTASTAAQTVRIDTDATVVGTGVTIPTSTAVAAASRGFVMRWQSAGSGNTVDNIAAWTIDPTIWTPDPFADSTTLVQIWARARWTSPPTSWTVIASIYPADVLATGWAKTYTYEYGATGVTLPDALTVGTTFRLIYLGSLSVPQNFTETLKVEARVVGSAPATSDFFDLDYLWLVPGQFSFSSPTGKSGNPLLYPVFFQAANLRRLVKTDLTSAVCLGPQSNAHLPTAGGMAGVPFEMNPGLNAVSLHGSYVIPNEPGTFYAADDNLYYPMSVNFAVTPRHRLAAV